MNNFKAPWSDKHPIEVNPQNEIAFYYDNVYGEPMVVLHYIDKKETWLIHSDFGYQPCEIKPDNIGVANSPLSYHIAGVVLHQLEYHFVMICLGTIAERLGVK